MKRYNAILLFCFFFLVSSIKGQTLVTDLRCDWSVNPLGVNSVTPKLGWVLNSTDFHVIQQAYQILVASSVEKLQNNKGDVWDSGKITSDQSQLIVYNGATLEHEKKYFWKVKVWTNKNLESPWSDWSSFRVAPKSTQLQPTWIGAIRKADSQLPVGRKFHTATFKRAKKDSIINASHPLSRQSILLRKPFTISKNVKEAVVYISGLGHYELTFNGEKVGNSEFAPLWTDYDKSVNYNTYELSPKAFNKGANAIGVILGNGMYNVLANRYSKFFASFGPPTLFFRLKIDFEDGSSTSISSDETWHYSHSPITYNSLFGGEDYDANLEQIGWDTSTFTPNANWKPVVLQEAPKGILKPQKAAANTIQKTFEVQELSQPNDSTFVFNMGQNLSGFPALKVTGKKGQKLTLWVGEGLKEDGTISQGRSGKPYYFQYTLKGDGIESWQPKFSYYGYQYIQIQNINYLKANNPELPTVLEITSNFVYNNSGEVGTFECSNTIFNKAHELINNAVKSNFQAVFTDCPHREKLGWLEEAHLNGPGLMFNYDLSTYFSAMMQNIADAQRENGMIPSIAPEYVVFGGDFTDSPEWGASGVILPWMYYEFYGDDSLIKKYYHVMKKYVDYLTSRSQDYILDYGLGDWYDYGDHAAGYSKNSPIALSATSHYYYTARLLTKAAKHLHKTADASQYEALATSIKKAFNDAFYNEKGQYYGTNSQFSNAVAIFMDLVDPVHREAVMQHLLIDIKNRGYRLTTGDVGNRYLFQALAQNNQNEVMYKMHNHYDTPGYGFQMQFGLTTLAEQWDPRKGNSWNHFMMGQIEEWFYKSLAGIQPDENAPGFKHFFIQPEIVGDMTYAKASYYSIYGKIVSHWEIQDNTIIFNVEVPSNTTATLVLPVSKNAKITINDMNPNEHSGVLGIGNEKNRPMFKVGSGVYNVKCLMLK